jgi:transcriptional regulator with XRE-family HTH domain
MRAAADEAMRRGQHSTANQFVGRRIRERRRALGLSQRKLGESIGGATPQQFYKYERGDNGVSAGLLYEIAGALHTTPDYFFDGFKEETTAPLPRYQSMLLDLMRSLGEIQSKEQIEGIGHLVRALAIDRSRDKRRPRPRILARPQRP